MNLLEHYIIEVGYIEVLNALPIEADDYYIKVKVFADCWGDKRWYEHYTTRKAWEQDLKKGYFMA